MLTTLLPPDVSPGFAVVLVVASFFTSGITAAFGLGGGVALLAVMAQGLPVATLIPVHGVAQLGSNAGRAIVQRAHMDRWTILWFALGSLVGVGLGVLFVIALPEPALRVGLALFILWTVYGHRPTVSARGSSILLVVGGFVSSFATMFFGATGPITMGFLAARGLAKKALVATHAGAMVIQHGLKIAAFGLIGFAYQAWAPLLGAVIAAGFVGTLVGSRVLDRMADRWFHLGFKIIMTLLALDLLVRGLGSLLPPGWPV